MAKSIIMSWSKCKVEVGPTGANDSMADHLTDIGVINDKSTTLATEDGETLTAKATGGVTVAEEEGEPTVTISTRVKEMSFEIERMFTGAEIQDGGDSLAVSSNIVLGDWSVKVTPKNIGATGIKAKRCHVSFKPGSSEEEGHYVDLVFKILECETAPNYWKFKVKGSDWGRANPDAPVATQTSGENAVRITCATSGATIKYRIGASGEWQTYSSPIDVTSAMDGETLYTKAVKDGLESSVNNITMEYFT